MLLNQNVHPSYVEPDKERKWESVSATFGGSGKGDCVSLIFTDQDGERFDIAIHYADDPQGLVDKLKIAVLSLPAIVKEKEKAPVGFAPPPWKEKNA